MPTYKLNIKFTDEGLDTLNAAGQFVTLVKSVRQGIPVAWISFKPMLTNTVTWSELYSVYASTSQIEDGAEIFTQSTHTATAGSMYTLNAGHFDSGKTGLAPNQYGVANSDPGFEIGNTKMITSGLYQRGTVNGTPTAGALNAVGVPLYDEAIFTPIEKVQIFASSYQNNGLVISSVTSRALELDLTNVTTQSLRYNASVNRFALI